MAMVQEIVLEDDDGTSYTIYVETDPVATAGVPSPPPASPNPTRSYDADTPRETYGVNRSLPAPVQASLETVHRTIRAYTLYALGAFKNLAGAEVEDLKLSFGIKINVDTGIPMLAKGAIDGDFKIEVTCKFPKG
ncbi:MAG: CU044_2847 family protein [Nodosilinea sp.]